jgi:putative DNA primase/helicase
MRAPALSLPDDKATFNRLHPIPFTVTIPADQIDKKLPAKLMLEAEGHLAWAVRGAIERNKSGLGKPLEVDAAANEWHSEMDQFGQFIVELCITGDGVKPSGAALYAAYVSWSKAAGEHPVTIKTFGMRVSNRLQKKHSEHGVVYLGIGIRPHYEILTPDGC